MNFENGMSSHDTTGPMYTFQEPSIKGFLDFISSQPSERKICHRGWDNDCVGDYMRFNGRIYPDILEFIDDVLDGLSQPLDGFDYVSSDGEGITEVITVETLFQLLDEAKLIEAAGVSLSTYGHLSDVLQAHLIVNLTDSLMV